MSSGLLLVSSLMAIASVVMFMFPRNFRGKKVAAAPPPKLLDAESAKKVVKVEEEPNQIPKFRDFPKTLKRQLKNDILMFRTASSVLHLLPVAGLYTFLPKYLETQFRVTTHDSALISGIGGISVMGIGIAMSGIIILKITPSARSVAAWIAFTALVYSAGMALLTQIGCPMHDFNGLQAINNNNPIVGNIIPSCELTCDCKFEEFSPICGSDGVTYFSSCQAGCKNATKIGDNLTFSDCKCIPSPEMLEKKFGTAQNGYCKDDCKSVYLFVVMFALFVFVHSTSEVGSMLLIMRCTHPKDKAMAMGIIQFCIGLFGNIPCPIIYGAVIDSACKVWGNICGKPGYCSLYDSDMFRHHFLGEFTNFKSFKLTIN
jgi:MFS family permease